MLALSLTHLPQWQAGSLAFAMLTGSTAVITTIASQTTLHCSWRLYIVQQWVPLSHPNWFHTIITQRSRSPLPVANTCGNTCTYIGTCNVRLCGIQMLHVPRHHKCWACLGVSTFSLPCHECMTIIRSCPCVLHKIHIIGFVLGEY